ncbi:hypothetical protein [Chitinophaga caseinilytica]|uniref:hypothetical protein n=1 Tax=Chitinophaga caseinilytica TaxID=2267521 RepID=UPI003C3007FB
MNDVTNMNTGLDVAGLEEEDALALEGSFKAILKYGPEIVTDTSISSTILAKLIENRLFNSRATVRIVNTFRLQKEVFDYFILQVEIDHGFRDSKKNGNTNRDREYQIWGYGKSRIAFGDVLMRRLAFVDKLLNRFTSGRIKFDYSLEFNAKYYLISAGKDLILKHFEPNFVAAVAQSDELIMLVNGVDVIIGFPVIINDQNTVTLQKIMSSASFLAKSMM